MLCRMLYGKICLINTFKFVIKLRVNVRLSFYYSISMLMTIIEIIYHYLHIKLKIHFFFGKVKSIIYLVNLYNSKIECEI